MWMSNAHRNTQIVGHAVARPEGSDLHPRGRTGGSPAAKLPAIVGFSARGDARIIRRFRLSRLSPFGRAAVPQRHLCGPGVTAPACGDARPCQPPVMAVAATQDFSMLSGITVRNFASIERARGNHSAGTEFWRPFCHDLSEGYRRGPSFPARWSPRDEAFTYGPHSGLEPPFGVRLPIREQPDPPPRRGGLPVIRSAGRSHCATAVGRCHGPCPRGTDGRELP